MGEEGIVCKLLDSHWVPDDRGNWVKLKPDYYKALDVDAVVIGGWWVGRWVAGWWWVGDGRWWQCRRGRAGRLRAGLVENGRHEGAFEGRSKG